MNPSEARFGHHQRDLIESNITPWRRAVVGDLTSAFDFRTPNTSRRIALPDTDSFKPEDLVRHPDETPVPPAAGVLPRQETGVRPARAIPYALHVHGTADEDALRISFRNIGSAAAVFHVRSAGVTHPPRTYTVAAGGHLSDEWDAAALGGSEYDVSVHGPNGFFRSFKGDLSGRHHARLVVRADYDEQNNTITLEIANRSGRAASVTIANAYRSRAIDLVLAPGETEAQRWSLTRTSGWYDLTLTVDGDPGFTQRLAGHLENGEDSISDPVMGGLV
jgi:phospholipase C